MDSNKHVTLTFGNTVGLILSEMQDSGFESSTMSSHYILYLIIRTQGAIFTDIPVYITVTVTSDTHRTFF